MRLSAVGVGACALDARWDALAAGRPPGLVVSAGVCGGLDPDLGAGTLVVPERVLGPDGEVLIVSPALRRAVLARVGGGDLARTLITSSEVVATQGLKAALRARTGAGAVDMESAAILRHAARSGIAALVLRAVSDTAAESLPAVLMGVITRDGRMRPLRAVAAVVNSPAALRDALRLRRGMRHALDAVAAALGALPGATV
jgi:adenosylhomocysteine nucleosidase